MNLNLDPRKNPNIVGEVLRGEFFNQELGYGCYSTFEVFSDVKQLPDESIDEDYDELGIKYNVFEKTIDNQIVTMKYYWDGDGTLEFYFEGGLLNNDDCKKDYGWKYFDDILDVGNSR